MAVLRRTSFLSQQRVDVPDMRAIESAVSADFDQLAEAFVTGTSQGYVLRGFEISMTGAIGGAASGLQMVVDPGALMHINASQSGTILMTPAGTPNQMLNGATNTNVNGAFVPNAINYVGIDYVRFLDPTTDAQVYFWDPTTKSETTEIVPRAEILTFSIVITTSTWASNVLPIAIVVTDAGNNVVSITDSRWMLFRLGTGGASPNPFFVYPWTAQPEGRTENPVTSTSNSVNPFEGGDKMLQSLKDWMNAVMSSLLEIKGTPYWYSFSSGGSITKLREDVANTITTGAGTLSHGVLPNTDPVLTTTGNISNGSNQILSLASTTGLVNGQVIFATGIPFGTTITNISGSTVTMSRMATLTMSGDVISFYDPTVVTQAGQINWNDPIFLDVIGSSLTYELSPNPTSADVHLLDDQVAYIILGRDVVILPNLLYVYNSGPNTTTVTSVGSISWTTGLLPGDFIRAEADSDAFYAKIKTVDSSTQVTLFGNYVPVGMSASGVKSVYALGTYNHSASPSGPRDIFISSRETVPMGQDVFWLFAREDNGGSIARVYVRFLGTELEQGDTNNIDDGVPRQLLTYIGSPMESASLPQYSSALNPGSIPQKTSITTGSGATVTGGQYFNIHSSGNYRNYYVWFKVNGVGTDPMPSLFNSAIEVDILSTDTAAVVASKLAYALNAPFFNDFNAVATSNTIVVTNNSAGTCTAAANFNVGAPFSITTTQTGTGTGNFAIQDGDNLTLAIKLLDDAVGAMNNFMGYDETITVVTSGATPPTSVNGPIAPTTNLTLPNNTRNGNQPQYYVVGKGMLWVFLNGQLLTQGIDWNEVGPLTTQSNQIETLVTLVVGDVLQLRISAGGAVSGTAGPPGPTGPPGADAAGGPVAISTKTGPTTYTVLSTDCVLRADASGGSITFNLPAASTVTGRIFYFKRIDSSGNTVTIDANGSETIDGALTQTLPVQYFSLTIISNGTSWDII